MQSDYFIMPYISTLIFKADLPENVFVTLSGRFSHFTFLKLFFPYFTIIYISIYKIFSCKFQSLSSRSPVFYPRVILIFCIFLGIKDIIYKFFCPV